jgi:hypothetical protein
MILAMDYAIWFGSLPGIVLAALTAYLSQRRLPRVERAWSRRAQAYLDLVDVLNAHNRQMWERLDKRVPPRTPYPDVLPSESDVVQRVLILASEPVELAVSEVVGAVIYWRETDEQRLNEEPRRFLGGGRIFGDRWHTPEDDFIFAGERVEDQTRDLCATLGVELAVDPPRRLGRCIRLKGT